jgi:hypothetical protein
MSRIKYEFDKKSSATEVPLLPDLPSNTGGCYICAMQTKSPVQELTEQAISEMPEQERKRFLAWAEHRARERADLTMLRAIRDYRRSRGISYPSTALNLQ